MSVPPITAPQTQTTPQTPSSSGGAPTPAPASSTAATATPTTVTPPAEFRYSEDPSIPLWARGKTSSEILGIAQGLYGQVQQQIHNPSPPPNPYPHGQPAYGQPAPQFAPTQPQYDPNQPVTMGDINAMAPRLVQDTVAPQLTQLTEQLASQSLAFVRQKHQVTFDKYGPEIYGTLANIPKNMWTVDGLEKVVKFVRADHVDEIAAEQAKQLVHTMEPGGTLRSNGGAGTVSGAPSTELTLQGQWEKLPADFRARLEKAGITDRTVDDWCRINSMTHQQFYDSIGKTGIVTEIGRVTRDG